MILSFVKRIIPSKFRPSGLLRSYVWRRSKGAICGGPFAGMAYTDAALCGAYVPKLLGTYELELERAISTIIARAPTHVIDIGGAEGYYAVGLARALANSKVYVFEQMPDGRRRIADMAVRNAVETRVFIHGTCSSQGLRDLLVELKTQVALICDVEGAEVDLLSDDIVPLLSDSYLIVEVHDSKRAGCRETIERRFGTTHTIEFIDHRVPVIDEYPFNDLPKRYFPGSVLKWGLSEFRSKKNAWLVMLPRASS